MTFTFGDFHNNYHKEEYFSNYSYGIWIPVELEKFNFVKKKMHMGLKKGLLSFQDTNVEYISQKHMGFIKQFGN